MEGDYYNEDDAWGNVGSGTGNYNGSPDRPATDPTVGNLLDQIEPMPIGGKDNLQINLGDGNWNNGSPPAIPLQAGHGWVFDQGSKQWKQVMGQGIGLPKPTGSPGPSGGSSGGSSGGYDMSQGFGDWSPGDAPNFDAPRWQAPPEFVYNNKFAAPNAQELQLDPSFQFRLDQGRKALEQSAAGKGVLRTGGTLKDLVNYGQNFATNEYSNVYNRKFGEYKFDYDKEADIYARNYNLKRDVFDRNYKAAYDEFSPKLKGWETNTNIKARQQEALFNRDWQKYLSDRDNEQEDWKGV